MGPKGEIFLFTREDRGPILSGLGRPYEHFGAGFTANGAMATHLMDFLIFGDFGPWSQARPLSLVPGPGPGLCGHIGNILHPCVDISGVFPMPVLP